MPQYIPFEPGTRVKCAYRKNDGTGYEHVGTVLAVNDPRVWTGSIAFGDRTPTQEEVDGHVAWCHSQNLLADAKQPVKWDFGKIYWDHQLYAAD